MNQQPTFDTPKGITMNFFEALKEVAAGNKITRLEWENASIYGFMKSERLHIHLADGKDHQWIVSEGDMAGVDWIVPESR